VIRNSCLCRIATWERPATLEAETPACRVSAAGCQSLGEGGFPSGTFGDISYEIHRGYLSPGDAVLFATDGLHEMRNQQGDDLSWGKLGEIWNQCRYKSADESLDFLFDEVQFFSADGRRHDDIAAIVLKVRQTPAAPRLKRLQSLRAATDFTFRTAAIGLVRLLGESLIKCAAFLGVRRLAAAFAPRYSTVGPDEASLARARREQAPALLEMARDLLGFGGASVA
jgi:Stage II sporulation protein E (SpoIIE)